MRRSFSPLPQGGEGRVRARSVRKVPPVALLTAATILAPTASISASVRVRSTGCRVTEMAMDFLPSPSALPANRSKTATSAISALSAPRAARTSFSAATSLAPRRRNRARSAGRARPSAAAAPCPLWRAAAGCVEIDLEADGRALDVEGLQHARMQLAELRQHGRRPAAARRSGRDGTRRARRPSVCRFSTGAPKARSRASASALASKASTCRCATAQWRGAACRCACRAASGADRRACRRA